MAFCPFHRWPKDRLPVDACTREGVVSLKSPATGRRGGLRIKVCREHEALYRSSGWIGEKEEL